MRALILLATSVWLSAMAPAPPVDRFYDGHSPIKTWEMRGIQARFGACVVKKHSAVARQFVLAPDLEKTDWRRAVAILADGNCLVAAATSTGGVEMKFPADTMRYALADALVRREVSASVPTTTDAAPLIQPVLDEAEYVPKPGRKMKPAELDELGESRAKRLGMIYLAGYGECVVRADVAQSHALLMADPATVEEEAAFGRLKPALSQCIIAGQSLTFNKTTLRGTIAMNFYRLAHAPRAATQSANK